jgi:TusA-related sulfurtransferase
MNKKINCCNMACPEPVLRVKEAIESIDEGILDVELNSFSSIENVKRFAKNSGFYYEQKKDGKITTISIVKGYECGIEPNISQNIKSQKSFWALIAGSIVTAILASTCCIGPLLFLLFGVSASSLGFLKILAPYHNIFSLIAIGVIGYLWYYYFKVIRNMIVCQGWICKYYLQYLIVGTILVAILLSYQYWVVYLIGE